MKLKAILALFLIFAMVFPFAACNTEGDKPAGSGEAEATEAVDNGSTEAPAPVGAEYDTGKFKVIAPEGWSAVAAPDFWDETAIDEYAVYLVNMEDVTEITDDLLYIDATPYIKIEYTSPDGLFFEPDRIYYSDIEDLNITVGGQEWTGFRGTLVSLTTIIWTQYSDGAYAQASFSHFEGDPLSNPDVQAILAGISH